MKIRTLLLALVAAGALAPAADAATYCVSKPGCTGDWHGDDLQTALGLAAASTQEGDDVKIGPGVFTRNSGFWYAAGANPANALTIEGVEGQTILRTESQVYSGGGGPTLLRVEGTGKETTWVHGLRLEMSVDTGAPSSTGLELKKAAAEDMEIATQPGKGGGVVAGAELEQGSALRRADVSLPQAQTGSGILLGGSGNLVESVTVKGGERSIVADQAASAEVRRADVEAPAGDGRGIQCRGCSALTVDNSVLRVGGTAVGLEALSLAGTPVTVDASHLTIVGATPNDAIAVRAATEAQAGSATVRIDNSVLQTVHWTFAADAHSSGTGPAAVVTRRSSFQAGKEKSANGGKVDSLDTLPPGPGFADQIGGDYRLRYDSALLDAGRISGVFVPSVFDRSAFKRVVDGDGDGDARPDVGAFEYRGLAPVAQIAGPKTATAGEAVTLDAAASHGGDPGEKVTGYKWKLPDGSEATTPSVTFALPPGTHQATLWVTDPTGKVGARIHEIVVPQPDVPPVGDEPLPPPTPASQPAPTPQPTPVPETLPAPGPPAAPLLSDLRAWIVRHRPRLALTLAEAATVSVRLERRAEGRWRRVQALRTAQPAGARRIALQRLRRRGSYRVRVDAVSSGRRAVASVRFRLGTR